jgi:hypothetical protein
MSAYIQLFLRVNWSKLAKTGQKVAKFPGKYCDLWHRLPIAGS